ncbi:MAG: histidine phosphatase family protein [Proteobacteria bacterium]|nr:histidine phosphatase family protein [Pseudomonadota bacterium]
MLPARPFYLLRHGESEANAARLTAGGGLDSPLNETGRAQARSLAALIDTLPAKPDIVYHSSMIRARETAEILNASLKLEIRAARDLREHEVGAWEGQPWDEVFPLILSRTDPPGGESFLAFGQRIQSVMEDIRKKNHRLPLLVAHGGVFHAIGRLYDHEVGTIRNCHLHYFEPHPPHGHFPWRVSRFDAEGGKLAGKPAPFCASSDAP